MILYWLTLAVLLLVVLVVAGYLIAIAVALLKAKRNVARLADGFEAVVDHTVPLEDRIGTIAAVLGGIDDDFHAADRHLSRAAEAF